MSVKPEAICKELMEINKTILRVSLEGCERIRKMEQAHEINVTVDFLRTLWRRRDIIINELRKAGVSEAELIRRMEEEGATG